ncbi:MAG: NifB/NifX family molybdenum-iron cluster-binding protein [Microbacter sp.]
MKIAFTSKGTTWNDQVDPRFGRTEFIVIFDEAINTLTSFDNRAVENEAHGAGTATSKKLSELRPDVLITGNGPGQNASTVLQRLNIKIYAGAGEMTLQQAYDAYKNGKLTEF